MSTVTLQNRDKKAEMIDNEKITTLVSGIKDKSKLTAVFLPSNFNGKIDWLNNEFSNTGIKFIPTTKEHLLKVINEQNPQEHKRVHYASDETGANKFLQSLIIAQATGNLKSIDSNVKNMLIAYANDKDRKYENLSIQDIVDYFEHLESKNVNVSGLSGVQNIATILNDFENQHAAILSRKNKKPAKQTS